jgi:hypothetical protein
MANAARNPLFLDRAALTLTLSRGERGLVTRNLQTHSKHQFLGFCHVPTATISVFLVKHEGAGQLPPSYGSPMICGIR